MDQLNNLQLGLQVPRIIVPAGFPSLTKSDDYPFKCSQCGLCFKNEIELTAHDSPEPNIESYKILVYKPPLSAVRLPCANQFNYCELCSKYFNSNQGFRQHLGKVHESQGKNAECNICHKLFKHKHALKFHVDQVHDTFKRVPCIRCKKEFYNKYKLKNHLRKCKVVEDLSAGESVYEKPDDEIV
ncbi:unnamed protein product [Blepharisma stoltei]|uniref:C2H2-type domain-containing protein n=1 Tax=Blepharisma stoltei TaxID=1481888 RepID=A0AAU9JQ83_9CILI|nr:unnamed protein product [Blepharisma stoltei]